MLEHQMDQVLGWGTPVDYPVPVTAAWDLSLERLRRSSPEAVELLNLCSFFAPEPIARVVLRAGPGISLPGAIYDVLGSVVETGRAIAHLGRYALVRADQQSVRVHRLVRAVVQRGIPRDQRDDYRQAIQTLLAAHSVRDPTDEAGRRLMALIGPHVVASGAISSAAPDVHRMVIDQIRFLHSIGDRDGSRKLARLVAAHWRISLGLDHPSTRTVESYSA
jgi:hypothetical protein